MTRQKVIESFCKLANEVQEKKFKYTIPADCFCGKNKATHPSDYFFDKKVLSFIQEVIRKELRKCK